jgi:GntR family transcriptional regulator/MocR family aminotransferase
MPKRVTPPEITLGERPSNVTLTRWLHQQLRQSILDGRLKSGTRLPASRDFANHYKLSRGTVVAVFEELQAEGYLSSTVGAGTWVNELPENPQRARKSSPPVRILPPPLTGLTFPHPARPFRCHEPAVTDFPMDIWARLASRRLRAASAAMLAERDPRGHLPLREALADYLGVSRGVNCAADQIVIVSGVQQALDLLARVLLKPGDRVWMEDPGYFGAVIAFRNARANIIPVPVDERGISVTIGRQRACRAKGAYITPAHQFPLGVLMPLERRLEILAWARETGAFLIEDDYDSEYRFEGRPAPVLQSLDKNESVLLIGSFNKLLFPALRLGYIVVPSRLVDTVLAFRFGIDQNSVGLEQAVLSDFITEGHMGRHIRRMRELYAGRLTALKEESRRYLGGLIEIPHIPAGLSTVGFLRNGMSSREAEIAAAGRGIETMALDRFTLERKDVQGLLLGFAAFDESRIRRGIASLAMALEQRRAGAPAA